MLFAVKNEAVHSLLQAFLTSIPTAHRWLVTGTPVPQKPGCVLLVVYVPCDRRVPADPVLIAVTGTVTAIQQVEHGMLL